MSHLNLSTLCLLLGALVLASGAYGFWKPAEFAAHARKFPRNLPAGYVLMALGTVWFLYYLSQESIADFATFKTGFYILFAAVGLGACLFVKDFLAVRGFAVVILLLAKLMVDTARDADTAWRLVIVVPAYVLVLAGMWFTVSPWRARDLIDWGTATTGRVRLFSAVRLGFAALLLVLALTVFRGQGSGTESHADARVPAGASQAS